MKPEKTPILIVFGTRPEVIKIAPLVRLLESHEDFSCITCATGQHLELLEQSLEFFKIRPDHSLKLMKENQSLFDITSGCLIALKSVYEKVKPKVVLVQGDTTTAMAAALAAFYLKVPVGHVEAGLRTWDKFSPFPEEMNRKLVGALAEFHFVPSLRAQKNLLDEGIPPSTIYNVGNTVVDSLLWSLPKANLRKEVRALYQNKKMILLTVHRRENFGEGLRSIFTAVKEFALKRKDFQIVYPVHPNPQVQSAAKEILKGVSNISLIDALPYGENIQLLSDCQFVMTDSGGLQEEAPSLGKPLLVLRESTERQEVIESGNGKLVGTDPKAIVKYMEILSDVHSLEYQSMKKATNPFGDGTAAQKIIAILEEKFIAKRSKAA